MRTRRVVFLLFGLFLTLVLSACGGGGGKTPPVVAATVAPSPVTSNPTKTINIVSTAQTPSELSVTVDPSLATMGNITQTGSGQFSVTVTPTTLDPFDVIVSVPAKSATSSVRVTPVVQIPMAVSPSGQVLADGLATAIVTADFSSTGLNIPDNQPVTFTATNGAVLTNKTATSADKATVTISSSTVGTSTVTASYKGSSGTVNVVFAQPQFAVTASKNIALVNTDIVPIAAAFSGIIPPDNTPVTFSVPAGAVLGNGTNTETVLIKSGTASTSVKSTTVQNVTVTAVSENITATSAVRFINQPTSMKVSIALNPAVSALATLQFTLTNSEGATFDTGSEKVVNGAIGSLATAGVVATNVTNVSLVANSINTLTTPIIELTYTISSGLPTVSVSNSSGQELVDPNNATGPLKPVDNLSNRFVVTIDYL